MASESPRNTIIKMEHQPQNGQGGNISSSFSKSQQPSVSTTMAHIGQSPHHQNRTQSSPSHAANMEGASGVPEKIEEAVEPE